MTEPIRITVTAETHSALHLDEPAAKAAFVEFCRAMYEAAYAEGLRTAGKAATTAASRTSTVVIKLDLPDGIKAATSDRTTGVAVNRDAEGRIAEIFDLTPDAA